MDKIFMGMAEARYPAIVKKYGPAAAHKKWAEQIGKKVVGDED